MKNLLFVIFVILIRFLSFSQDYIDKVFINILNNYRTLNGINEVVFDFQHYDSKIITNSYNVLVYVTNESKDTSYKWVKCTSDLKIIPKYNDRNTSQLFVAVDSIPLDSIYDDSKLPLHYLSDSFNYKSPITVIRYFDSLALHKVFKTLILSKENESILLSNYQFFFQLNKTLSKNKLNRIFTIKAFEIVDEKNASISSDYGFVIYKGNFNKLKPYIVDEFTKKLLYTNK